MAHVSSIDLREMKEERRERGEGFRRKREGGERGVYGRRGGWMDIGKREKVVSIERDGGGVGYKGGGGGYRESWGGGV